MTERLCVDCREWTDQTRGEFSCRKCREKRWTLEELRQERNRWIESIPARSESPINDFLDWLAQS